MKKFMYISNFCTNCWWFYESFDCPRDFRGECAKDEEGHLKGSFTNTIIIFEAKNLKSAKSYIFKKYGTGLDEVYKRYISVQEVKDDWWKELFKTTERYVRYYEDFYVYISLKCGTLKYLVKAEEEEPVRQRIIYPDDYSGVRTGF